MTSIESRTTCSVALEDIFSSPKVMVARAPWMTQVCHAGTAGFSSAGVVLLMACFFVPQLTIITAAHTNPIILSLFTYCLLFFCLFVFCLYYLNMPFYLCACRAFRAVTQRAVEIKEGQLGLSLTI